MPRLGLYNIKSIFRGLFWYFHRIFLKVMIYKSTPYTPVGNLKQPMSGREEEAFKIRWEVVSKVIDDNDVKNLIDIGCAEGFFVRKAYIDKHIFALGLDIDQKRIRIGQAYADINQEKGYGFVCKNVNPDTLCLLPKFDVVICFSVLHHIIALNGIGEGHRFLKSLINITRKCLIFDMGSPREKSHDWATKLTFLNDDIPGKTKELLESAGFINVKYVADTYGHNNDEKRPLFICHPPKN